MADKQALLVIADHYATFAGWQDDRVELVADRLMREKAARAPSQARRWAHVLETENRRAWGYRFVRSLDQLAGLRGNPVVLLRGHDQIKGWSDMALYLRHRGMPILDADTACWSEALKAVREKSELPT